MTGATGFLGWHLLPKLEANFGKENVIGVSRQDYDLMNNEAFDAMFKKYYPEVFIHLGAYSGGIGANKLFPADFYYINTILTTYGFEYAAKYKVKKMIYPMGGCSYPADAISPIDESQMWEGYPQPESAGYSCAKKMGIVASQSYRRQYGLDSVVLIPGNMYGEYDNFKKDESHVIPAMIRRYYEAKKSASNKITMWGTGNPERDFVYAGDVAEMILWFIDNYNETGPVNLSSGTRTSIKNLAATVAELIGYQGEIEWDPDKPEGQMVKIFSVDKMRSLGLEATTGLREGLQKTIAWFEANYSFGSDRIRL